MQPINTLPLGFLDLLGLQQQGQSIRYFADELRGVLDLTPHYYAYKRTFAREDNFFAAAASSSLTIATVPAGEYWVILGGMIQSASAAGGTGSARVEVLAEGRVVFVSDTLSVAAASASQAVQIDFRSIGPVIATPGSVINKLGYGLAGAGAERALARVAYVPLRG